eukprot:119558-Chlamydomonas_euryale.AAC.1
MLQAVLGLRRCVLHMPGCSRADRFLQPPSPKHGAPPASLHCLHTRSALAQLEKSPSRCPYLIVRQMIQLRVVENEVDDRQLFLEICLWRVMRMRQKAFVRWVGGETYRGKLKGTKGRGGGVVSVIVDHLVVMAQQTAQHLLRVASILKTIKSNHLVSLSPLTCSRAISGPLPLISARDPPQTRVRPQTQPKASAQRPPCHLSHPNAPRPHLDVVLHIHRAQLLRRREAIDLVGGDCAHECGLADAVGSTQSIPPACLEHEACVVQQDLPTVRKRELAVRQLLAGPVVVVVNLVLRCEAIRSQQGSSQSRWGPSEVQKDGAACVEISMCGDQRGSVCGDQQGSV